jgi:hypothetical protein
VLPNLALQCKLEFPLLARRSLSPLSAFFASTSHPWWKASFTIPMNSSPTALFDSYEQDFQQFIGTIREKLEGEGSDDRGGRQTYPSYPRRI